MNHGSSPHYPIESLPPHHHHHHHLHNPYHPQPSYYPTAATATSSNHSPYPLSPHAQALTPTSATAGGINPFDLVNGTGNGTGYGERERVRDRDRDRERDRDRDRDRERDRDRYRPQQLDLGAIGGTGYGQPQPHPLSASHTAEISAEASASTSNPTTTGYRPSPYQGNFPYPSTSSSTSYHQPPAQLSGPGIISPSRPHHHHHVHQPAYHQSLPHPQELSPEPRYRVFHGHGGEEDIAHAGPASGYSREREWERERERERDLQYNNHHHVLPLPSASLAVGNNSGDYPFLQQAQAQAQGQLHYRRGASQAAVGGPYSSPLTNIQAPHTAGVIGHSHPGVGNSNNYSFLEDRVLPPPIPTYAASTSLQPHSSPFQLDDYPQPLSANPYQPQGGPSNSSRIYSAQGSAFPNLAYPRSNNPTPPSAYVIQPTQAHDPLRSRYPTPDFVYQLPSYKGPEDLPSEDQIDYLISGEEERFRRERIHSALYRNGEFYFAPQPPLIYRADLAPAHSGIGANTGGGDSNGSGNLHSAQSHYYREPGELSGSYPNSAATHQPGPYSQEERADSGHYEYPERYPLPPTHLAMPPARRVAGNARVRAQQQGQGRGIISGSQAPRSSYAESQTTGRMSVAESQRLTLPVVRSTRANVYRKGVEIVDGKERSVILLDDDTGDDDSQAGPSNGRAGQAAGQKRKATGTNGTANGAGKKRRAADGEAVPAPKRVAGRINGKAGTSMSTATQSTIGTAVGARAADQVMANQYRGGYAQVNGHAQPQHNNYYPQPQYQGQYVVPAARPAPPPQPAADAPMPAWDDKDGHYVITPGHCVGEHDKYRIVKLLGQGTFGKVIEATEAHKTRRVAIKIIRAIPKYREASTIEIRVLKKLRDQDVNGTFKCIQLLEYFDFRNHICLVTPLLGQSVFDFLKENKFQPFPEAHIRDFAKDLITSLNFVHQNKLIHTDLKPENILLVSNAYYTIGERVKNAQQKHILRNTDIRLIDFGSATFENEFHSSVVSTRHYRAPEIILGLGWSYPCDLFSVGCILVEFFTGDALFQTHDNLEHLAMMEVVMGKMPQAMLRRAKNTKSEYFKGMSLDWPNAQTTKTSRNYVKKMKKLEDTIRPNSDHTHAFLDLIKGLLAFDPSRRLKCPGALNHPYFKIEPPAPPADPHPKTGR